MPIDALLSDAYNAERRKLITDQASLEIAPRHHRGLRQDAGRAPRRRRARRGRRARGRRADGRPHPWTHDEDNLPDASPRRQQREKLGAIPGDTVHFDIIDRDGNMVSSTPSGGWLHSSPVIPELGFCLGTRAQMFWLDEDHPAALAPGKRPRSTLTPTMALRDGEPYLAWGSPGGDQQDQWITQFFLRHVHAGMNLQESIDAPAWHSEHFPSSFWPRTARPGVMVVESRVPEATVKELRARGHEVEVGAGLVGRPADRGVARRSAPPRRRQSARHAGLRRRALTIIWRAAPPPRARHLPSS